MSLFLVLSRTFPVVADVRRGEWHLRQFFDIDPKIPVFVPGYTDLDPFILSGNV